MLEIEETVRSADGWKEESSERCSRARLPWRNLLGFNITLCYYGYLIKAVDFELVADSNRSLVSMHEKGETDE